MNKRKVMYMADKMFNLGREFESYAVNWDQENIKIIREKSLKLSADIRKELDK